MLQLTRDKHMSKASDTQVRPGIKKAASSMSRAMFTLRDTRSTASSQYVVRTSGSFSSLEKKSPDNNKNK